MPYKNTIIMIVVNEIIMMIMIMIITIIMAIISTIVNNCKSNCCSRNSSSSGGSISCNWIIISKKIDKNILPFNRKLYIQYLQYHHQYPLCTSRMNEILCEH